mmetsp:Transcript_79565/g.170588  ORF Transcript_79565/g.170588 Transcript_79565/m.170588 type:complete len:470 (-) Transcript_79565:430-1839(-)
MAVLDLQGNNSHTGDALGRLCQAQPRERQAEDLAEVGASGRPLAHCGRQVCRGAAIGDGALHLLRIQLHDLCNLIDRHRLRPAHLGQGAANRCHVLCQGRRRRLFRGLAHLAAHLLGLRARDAADAEAHRVRRLRCWRQPHDIQNLGHEEETGGSRCNTRRLCPCQTEPGCRHRERAGLSAFVHEGHIHLVAQDKFLSWHPGPAQEVITSCKVLIVDCEGDVLPHFIHKHLLDVVLGPYWVHSLFLCWGAPGLVTHLHDDIGVRSFSPTEQGNIVRPEPGARGQGQNNHAQRIWATDVRYVDVVIGRGINGDASWQHDLLAKHVDDRVANDAMDSAYIAYAGSTRKLEVHIRCIYKVHLDASEERWLHSSRPHNDGEGAVEADLLDADRDLGGDDLDVDVRRHVQTNIDDDGAFLTLPCAQRAELGRHLAYGDLAEFHGPLEDGRQSRVNGGRDLLRHHGRNICIDPRP